MSLVLVACVLLAGCTATSPSTAPTETTSVTSATPTETTSTCPPDEDLARRPLPDAPENVTRESVRSFAAAYEEASVWNRERADSTLSLGVHVSEATVVNRTGTGYVVHLEGGFSFEECLDGSGVAGEGIVRTNYFVNETTVVRLESPDSRAADPRNGGTVVERLVS
ncbi:hypothetical protein [Halomicrococcus gelatinilyticus]|uniref:hypothetical protein n=1 Tax=Halomicrococcus gelatinilyticus TaxID=1702103 RepID=UPI002E1058F6